MNWAQLSVVTTHEGAELVSDLLLGLGVTGVEIDDPKLVNDYIDAGLWDYTDLPRAEDTVAVIVRAYLPEDDELAQKIKTLEARLTEIRSSAELNMGSLETRQKILADEDWAESWKAYFHPEKIGERIVICPTWEEYDPSADEIVIELDPGAAFGTGNHATTAMCLRYLEKLVQPKQRLFDIGTGSGILAIAAYKLGAGEIIAVDYDSVAVRVAAENIAQNNAEGNIEVFVSDLFKSLRGRGQADIITANIIADIIIRLLPELGDFLAPEGTFLASGIIKDREADVLAALAENKFEVVHKSYDKEWVAMLIKRRQEA